MVEEEEEKKKKERRRKEKYLNIRYAALPRSFYFFFPASDNGSVW
jgi:hypothetical protein